MMSPPCQPMAAKKKLQARRGCSEIKLINGVCLKTFVSSCCSVKNSTQWNKTNRNISALWIQENFSLQQSHRRRLRAVDSFNTTTVFFFSGWHRKMTSGSLWIAPRKQKISKTFRITFFTWKLQKASLHFSQPHLLITFPAQLQHLHPLDGELIRACE